MAKFSYPPSSPYATTPVIDDTYLDMMKNISIPKYADDVYWNIRSIYQYRPDLLAYDLYNSSKLWWVFANRNPDVLKDPLFDFVPGNFIFLPKLATLQSVLGV